jgi:hypothetical protein
MEYFPVAKILLGLPQYDNQRSCRKPHVVLDCFEL